MKPLLSFITFIFFYQYCFADWPVKKKRIQLIATYSYYHSSSYFNNKGTIVSLTQGNKYVSHYFGLYTMYGITDRLDLLVNIPIANQRLTAAGIRSTTTGIADMYIGFAYHFPSENLKKFITLKGSFILPGYQNISTPSLGYASKGYQLGIAFSFNPSPKTYIGAEANYTKYLDQVSGPIQYFFSSTLGYYLNDFEKITFNFSHQLSTSSDNSFSTNLTTNKDFLVGRMTVGYGRKITRTITPYLQFYFTPYGYNTGSASGFSMYTIIKIP